MEGTNGYPRTGSRDCRQYASAAIDLRALIDHPSLAFPDRYRTCTIRNRVRFQIPRFTIELQYAFLLLDLCGTRCCSRRNGCQHFEGAVPFTCPDRALNLTSHRRGSDTFLRPSNSCRPCATRCQSCYRRSHSHHARTLPAGDRR